ncbi:methylenetetrahydrofolate reductase [Marinilabilia sp.]|uniref:methylenetetrahydrofolate reductase n=1 Tax=Marinilabilia sp. TaxID=2021252 RepID=UPI0025B89041|nr:methylenetetrahydrofolate reductase [Marinilabilia sp.]
MPTVAELIRNSDQPSFSFELLPPLKGNSIRKVFNTIDQLKEFNPLYINITSHRDEVVYKPNAKGIKVPHVYRKRPGTVAVAASIQHKYKIPVVPHMICSGFTRSETEYALIDLNFLGIHDLLLLRGDNSNRHDFVKTSEDSNKYAIDLIRQVSNLNNGQFLDGTFMEPFETPFSFGVAGYPEKHEEATCLEADILRLKEKVDAGGEYIITQMFFDNSKFFEFVQKCREAGITVPIVPGLKPINYLSQVKVLPEIFHTQFPEPLTRELLKCSTNEDVAKVGTEWAIHQSKELLVNGFNLIHFYTMMATKCVFDIAKHVY